MDTVHVEVCMVVLWRGMSWLLVSSISLLSSVCHHLHRVDPEHVGRKTVEYLLCLRQVFSLWELVLIAVPLLLQWTTRYWRTRSLHSLMCSADRVPPPESGFMVGKGMSLPDADCSFNSTDTAAWFGCVTCFKDFKMSLISLKALARSLGGACFPERMCSCSR